MDSVITNALLGGLAGLTIALIYLGIKAIINKTKK